MAATLLFLADDLTGALEIGAKLAAHGIEPLVAPEWTPEHAALVVNTETRHCSPEEAARRVRAVASAAHAPDLRLLYKKTDSTLRGNIGSELAVLRQVFPELPLVYAPAYPAMGRTVKGGCLYVDGVPVSDSEFARDALNPVRESYIPRVLGAGIPVATLEAARGPALYVVDGETGRDLDCAAEWLLSRAGLALAAGPAALAEAIARRIEWPRVPPRAFPRIRRCLVVNGSRHPLSARQVEYAEARGWPAGWTVAVLEVPGSGLERAVSVGRMVLKILEREEPEALVVFGGDTAAGIVNALGQPPLYPLGEVVPGVPISRAGPRYLITKAGGFGPVEVLCQVQAVLAACF